MITAEERERIAKVLAAERIGGLDAFRSGDVLLYLDGLVAVTVTLQGVLYIDLDGQAHLYGLYPQGKTDRDTVKSFRQAMGRALGVDWREH
jgi:hypothetical protein